jgi:hypothetical protein
MASSRINDNIAVLCLEMSNKSLLVMYLLIGQTIYKQIQARKNRYSICRQNELRGSTDTSNKMINYGKFTY